MNNEADNKIMAVASEVHRIRKSLMRKSVSPNDEPIISVYMSTHYWMDCMNLSGEVSPVSMEFLNTHTHEKNQTILGCKVYQVLTNDPRHPPFVINYHMPSLIG